MATLVTDSGRKTPARLAGSAILACQSDERLVKLVRSGHERAFDAIVQRYRKPLVHYCKRILPESRCEDAVQQAFINAHAALASSDEAVQLKPWLYAITRNAALNMLRQNGWNYEEIPLDFDGVRRPDQVFEQRAELQQTVAALNDLPERQRSALVMREFEGRSYDEIALALGANDGAVRQLLNRARVTLRSAASALIPPPLVARAASLPPSDGRRLAEIVGGFGAAGMAKAGATALVAGTLVVGAVKAPLPVGESHKTTREKATLSTAAPASAAKASSVAAHDTPIALHQPKTAPAHSNRGSGHSRAVVHRQSSNSGSGHSGSSGRELESERHGTSGSDDTREHSGTTDDRTRERSGSDDSTSGTSGSDDHSGTSGTSGSDDSATTLTGTDDSSSTSGTSGDSGTSGTSGTSGSDDYTSSNTSGTSGSGDSTSGTSGSGTSGSSNLLEH